MIALREGGLFLSPAQVDTAPALDTILMSRCKCVSARAITVYTSTVSGHILGD